MSKEQAPSPVTWRRRSLDESLWIEFDDDCLVYHRPSGKTHFLNAASQVLINEILAEPRNFAEIATAFAPDSADSHAAAYLQQMKAMLDRLEILGLVETV